MKPEAVMTTQAPAAVGPYSQAIRFGNLLFLSGQIALDRETGTMVGTDVQQQTERILMNMEAVLQSQGLELEHLLKTTVFLLYMDTFAMFNATYAERMTKPYPARSTVAVSALPKGALIEIEGIAHFP